MVALPAPVLLLDLLDLFFAHAEVVADLVNQRLADRHDQIVLVLGFALVRALKEQDAVGQRIAVVPAAFGQRRALVQAEQRVGRLDLHLVEQLAPTVRLRRRWRCSHGVAEAARDAGERLSDAALERRRGSFDGGVAPSAAACAHVPARRARAGLCRRPSLRPLGASRSGTGLKIVAVVLNRRTGRRAASACRCAGRAESACRRSRVQRSGGSAAHSCCSTTSGSSDSAMPMRLATRSTWRSTGRPGHAERVAEHDVRRLAADAGQRGQRRPCRPAPRRRARSTSACAMPMSAFDFARKKPVE